MADRAIRYQSLEVSLSQGRETTIDDACHSDRDQDVSGVLSTIRTERERDPNDAVSTHFQQDACQNHRDRCRCLNVSVRQPRVKREAWYFDRKTDEQQNECGDLQTWAEDIALLCHRSQLHQIERTDLPFRSTPEVEHQNCDQHQNATCERVEKELDRCVLAAWSAPDADEKIHRQQHDFPEYVEQEEVERQEHAEHSRFQQQKQNQVSLHLLLDAPRSHHR